METPKNLEFNLIPDPISCLKSPGGHLEHLVAILDIPVGAPFAAWVVFGYDSLNQVQEAQW